MCLAYFFLFAAKGIAKIVSKFPANPITAFMMHQSPSQNVNLWSDEKHWSGNPFELSKQKPLHFLRILELELSHSIKLESFIFYLQIINIGTYCA